MKSWKLLALVLKDCGDMNVEGLKPFCPEVVSVSHRLGLLKIFASPRKSFEVPK